MSIGNKHRAPSERPIRILLIEDNEAHIKLILRALTSDGSDNSVNIVKDGEEALDYLLRRKRYADPINSPRPDLILLDLKLPKIGGIDVLIRIKTDPTLSMIPVVVLTSSSDERDLRKAYANYANSFLSKPVDYDEFHEMVKELEFYWTIWNRQPKQSD